MYNSTVDAQCTTAEQHMRTAHKHRGNFTQFSDGFLSWSKEENMFKTTQHLPVEVNADLFE